MTDNKRPFKKTFKSKPYSGSKPGSRPDSRADSRPAPRPIERAAPRPARADDDRPPPKLTGRPQLHIDMSALKANYLALQNTLKRPGKPVTIGACVKADAYGLGMGPIGKALYGLGCRSFFVAHAFEGRQLRAIVGDAPSIYVFNGPSEAEMPIFFVSKLKPVLNSMEQVRLWLSNLERHEFQPRVAIHIDTGMNRLGFTVEDLASLAAHKPIQDKLAIELVMSHLACAPDAKHPMNKTQLAAFKKAAGSLPPVSLSLANSAGIYLGKDYHFNMVRPGAALYGLQTTNSPAQEVTRPVVTLSAPIMQIRKIATGESAGYNASFTAKRPTRVITVGAGYADGIPVALSNKSYGTLRKQKLPVIGRVSMDLTMLDATDYVGDLKTGLPVMFLGDQLETQTQDMGGLNYEMLTRLGSRFRRNYE